MGYSLSWAAIKGGAAEAVHSILGVRATDLREEIPESDTVAAQLPTGWHLVLFKRKTIEDEVLARLSSLGEVVYCFVEDHVMVSTASGWNDGSRRWSITHDSEKGMFHLQVDGQVPSNFAPIRERLVAEQNANGGEKSDTDFIYDVPVELAWVLTGFRHDQNVPGLTGDCFHVLERVKKNPWNPLRALFGHNNK